MSEITVFFCEHVNGFYLLKLLQCALEWLEKLVIYIRTEANQLKA